MPGSPAWWLCSPRPSQVRDLKPDELGALPCRGDRVCVVTGPCWPARTRHPEIPVLGARLRARGVGGRRSPPVLARSPPHPPPPRGCCPHRCWHLLSCPVAGGYHRRAEAGGGRPGVGPWHRGLPVPARGVDSVCIGCLQSIDSKHPRAVLLSLGGSKVPLHQLPGHCPCCVFEIRRICSLVRGLVLCLVRSRVPRGHKAANLGTQALPVPQPLAVLRPWWAVYGPGVRLPPPHPQVSLSAPSEHPVGPRDVPAHAAGVPQPWLRLRCPPTAFSALGTPAGPSLLSQGPSPDF